MKSFFFLFNTFSTSRLDKILSISNWEVTLSQHLKIITKVEVNYTVFTNNDTVITNTLPSSFVQHHSIRLSMCDVICSTD